MNKRYHVYLVASTHRVLAAPSVEVAEAVALADAQNRWPGLHWTVADTEEEL